MKREASLHRVFSLLTGGLLVAIVLLASVSPADGPPLKDMAGTQLIFELDRADSPDAKERPSAVQLEKIVDVLQRRVRRDDVYVRRGEGDRIEALIVETDPKAVRRIQNLLERSGTLEFRVLANNRDHKKIIERALTEKTPVVISKAKDDKGEYPVLAWWVTLDGSERFKDKDERGVAEDKSDDETKDRVARDKKRVASLLAYPEICKRTIEQGDKEIDQVLVVKDDFGVNGQYLADVSPGNDSSGRNCINFRFNQEGAKRLSGLTKGNLPEEDGTFTRKLGIIIDGRLYIAPSVQSTISDRGEITGEFTRQEVEDLVVVLNAGSLPIKIKLVEKHATKPETP